MEELKEQEYYNGDDFINSKDLYGRKPEIFISQSIRSYGKTTYYHNRAVKGFLENKKQFCMLYRNINEVKGAASRLQGIVAPFFRGLKLNENLYAGNAISEISLDNGDVMAYAFALSGYEKIKKNSNLFSNADHILFDEFLNEDNKYLKGEVDKLISVHTSVARAPGTPVRRVPVFLISNKINIMNPYFIALGIVERLQPRTRKLRGDGWILEIQNNVGLKNQLKESAFNRAFASQAYMGYITDENNKFVNEMIDVGKIKGDKRYIHTFVQNGEEFGCWICNGLYYISQSVQPNFRRVIGVEISDRILTPLDNINYNMLLLRYRKAFEQGLVRYSNGHCKQMFVNYLLKYGDYN